jgi:hypothetical protein
LALCFSVFRKVNTSDTEDPNRLRLTKVASDIVFKQVESLTFELGASRDAAVIDFEELKAKPAGIPNLITDVVRLRCPEAEAIRHPERRFELDVFGRNRRPDEQD